MHYQVKYLLNLFHFDSYCNFGVLQKNGFSALLLRGEGADQTPLISFCITVEQNAGQYVQLSHCLQRFWANNRLPSRTKPEPVYRFS